MSVNKMINAKMTVIQLKAEAKAQGLKRYSKLRKADLLQLFNGAHVGGANDNIIDAPVHDRQTNTLIQRQSNHLIGGGVVIGNNSLLDTKVPEVGVEPLKPTKFQAFKS